MVQDIQDYNEIKPFFYIFFSIPIWEIHKYFWCVNSLNPTNVLMPLILMLCYVHVFESLQFTYKCCSGKQVNESRIVIENLCCLKELFILVNKKNDIFSKRKQIPALWVQACVCNREKCSGKLPVSICTSLYKQALSSVSTLDWYDIHYALDSSNYTSSLHKNQVYSKYSRCLLHFT